MRVLAAPARSRDGESGRDSGRDGGGSGGGCDGGRSSCNVSGVLRLPSSGGVVTNAAALRAPAKSAPAPRSITYKLLNTNFDLMVEELQQQLSDATDFTVIGVLGHQGVGKSTVMSLLAGASWCGDGLCEPPFPPQSIEVVLGAAHQTVGVDVMLTPERLILLDTQPLLSPSVLLEMQRQQPPLPAEAQTYENLQELFSLRLSMLMLSVCHQVRRSLHPGKRVDVSEWDVVAASETA